ncbi:MAG: RimK family alpha-L-glutamate ligase [Candidatus Aenigmatarchaeota archaeon]
MKTILVVGDNCPTGHRSSSTCLNKFCGYRDFIEEQGWEMKKVGYKGLLRNELPEIEGEITVMFFFPYIYWNENIENDPDEVYGNSDFGKKFNELFYTTESIIYNSYGDDVRYVNSPSGIMTDRDKKHAKEILWKNNIPTPKWWENLGIESIHEMLDDGRKIYAKPRYGSMGKGISVLTKDRWMTNFDYKDGKIKSMLSDYGWKFREMEKDDEFLRTLLRNDFLFEEGIKTPRINDRKFDLRVYAVYKETPYYYARSAPPEAITTNISQGQSSGEDMGGRTEGKEFLDLIPEDKLEEAKNNALETAQILGLNYAGVDIIFSEDYEETYVLEAQSFPSPESRFDLMKYIIEKITS